MKFKHAVAVASIALAAPIVTRASDLGVNYNGTPRSYVPADVARAQALWIRTFVDVRKLQHAGVASLAANPDLIAIARMHDEGFKVIVNLKYDFTSDPFPSDPTSPEFVDLRAFTTRLLDCIYPKVDVVVVGNEPFIESNPDNRPDLAVFYQHMANHVITYARDSGRPILLFVGAFNNLQNPRARIPAVEALFRYARNTPQIAGVDLHLHVSSIGDMRAAIDYAKGEAGPGKRLISTEFSLKNYFKAQLEQPVDARFAAHWHVDPTWKVWQFINDALNDPRPRDEWLDFLRSSAWFVAVQSSLTDADELFDREGLVVATYAMRQTQSNIGPQTDPWVLNALYCNQTCQDKAPRVPAANIWLKSFRARQPDFGAAAAGNDDAD